MLQCLYILQLNYKFMNDINTYNWNGLLNDSLYQKLKIELVELDFIIKDLFLQEKIITKKERKIIKWIYLNGVLDLETWIYTPWKNIFFTTNDWALLHVNTSDIKIKNFIINKLQNFLNSSLYWKKLMQMNNIHESYKN